jgi:hypothetical protein
MPPDVAAEVFGPFTPALVSLFFDGDTAGAPDAGALMDTCVRQLRSAARSGVEPGARAAARVLLREQRRGESLAAGVRACAGGGQRPSDVAAALGAPGLECLARFPGAKAESAHPPPVESSERGASAGGGGGAAALTDVDNVASSGSRPAPEPAVAALLSALDALPAAPDLAGAMEEVGRLTAAARAAAPACVTAGDLIAAARAVMAARGDEWRACGAAATLGALLLSFR